ncbi:type II toxin-antitoxin system MqsA family antitoxin [Marinobacter sp.]|uniref:type II toxin-antitoxin system MqsA family antitoxin n=1 Tax=unclassified Marinobacter TaxID=83889 RepID=UPI0029C5C647|nr:type II toxin-antitoxin system MqsA family antitoxin [Marinobacter sp.]MDX5335674.1 type II toxin-antitoxin system MqsA family antitoxin [Marinobacter sp.]MDX5386646.1 type II toxin-antitoxin system MqsA family antitoxin [Marinobacter sp.]MDX5441652.1 type II toxin-antitoxin system MqsA family antitoxin [Alteromonadaceae bacterium]MDX5472068.1 type II toxin-antitoxin system MqsA family antitoxin [Marinobacter sp.]|tara:strand:+ start:248 stop:472 length:225 start_codon:yes stop_codon:yes gene_type:complete
MKCAICKNGETHSGTTTVTMTRGEATIVVKNVPAEVCDNCGEYYLDEAISAKILTMAEEAIKQNHEVEVIQFAA